MYRSIFSVTYFAFAFLGLPALAGEPTPSDVAQANRFLTELPSACSGSYTTIAADGSVNVHIACDRNGKKMDGLVVIKDGKVTQIR